jgi:predicted GNAT family acetyltransferase
MDYLLDNPAWNALTTGNSHLSEGNKNVKFFDKEVSPFIGLRENTEANFRILYELLPHNGPVCLISPVEIRIPDQWQLVRLINCLQMVYAHPAISTNITMQPVPLTDKDVPEMMELVKLTNPGPFATRTIEFGHYHGFFCDDKLVAMTGQRMHAGDFMEVSAVCTHPDYLGNGYARQLLLFHLQRIIAASGTPFLHVRHDNHRAIEVYKHVGFTTQQEMHFYFIKKR